MTDTLQLFEYGKLMTRGRQYDLVLSGQMRMRGNDPAVRFGKQYGGVVWGQVHEIAADKLPNLVRIERPQYSLQRLGTYRKRPLFAFVDVELGWEWEPIVANGKWRFTKSPASSHKSRA